MTNGSSRHSLDECEVASLAALFNFINHHRDDSRNCLRQPDHSLKSSDEHRAIDPTYKWILIVRAALELARARKLFSPNQ